MAKGFKTGGRAKGTPNKDSTFIAEKLAAFDCDPIEGMIKIAQDKDTPIKIKANMYAELAGYVYAKRKALDIDMFAGGTINANLNIRYIGNTDTTGV